MILCPNTLGYLHRSTSLALPNLTPRRSLIFLSRPFPRVAAARMSASVAAIRVVEHVVLFKPRDSTTPSQLSAMVSSLQSLTRLGIASHLTVGPIHSPRSSVAGFTHLLHSRYASEADLASYASHPDHQATVRDHVLPVCDDVMAVDWHADLGGSPAHLAAGSALRLTLLKLKPGFNPDDALAWIRDGIGLRGIAQSSCGENFSPARAKGYGLCAISVFPSIEDLQRAVLDAGKVLEREEKVMPPLESSIVLDYVVPDCQPLP